MIGLTGYIQGWKKSRFKKIKYLIFYGFKSDFFLFKSDLKKNYLRFLMYTFITTVDQQL